MKISELLKPCPFCGSQADIILFPDRNSGTDFPELHVGVRCSGCRTRSALKLVDVHGDGVDLADAWNTIQEVASTWNERQSDKVKEV